MIALHWADLLLWGGVGGFGCYAMGVATVLWWRGRRPVEVWELRTARDLDETRYREGAPYDGQYRGVRWLPTDDREGD
jgi:hypothetical protein